jgi:hypothetical protein
LENEDRAERRLYADKCQKRLKFLDELEQEEPGLGTLESWENIRNNRAIVEYLLGQGYFASAEALSENTNLNVHGAQRVIFKFL